LLVFGELEFFNDCRLVNQNPKRINPWKRVTR